MCFGSQKRKDITSNTTTTSGVVVDLDSPDWLDKVFQFDQPQESISYEPSLVASTEVVPIVSQQSILPTTTTTSDEDHLLLLKKRQRNTEAARQSRKRKAELISSLEYKVEEYKEKNIRMELDNAALKAENRQLKERLEQLSKQVEEMSHVLVDVVAMAKK